MPPLSVESLEALIVYVLFPISTKSVRSGEPAQPARSNAEERAMARWRRRLSMSYLAGKELPDSIVAGWGGMEVKGNWKKLFVAK